MSDAPWYLYLLRCADGSLYTGISTNVERRFIQHQNGQGAKRLRGQGPLQLEYQCEVGNRSMAQRIEYRVKRLTRSKKEALIRGQLHLPDAES